MMEGKSNQHMYQNSASNSAMKKNRQVNIISKTTQRTAMSPLTVIISLTNKSLKDEVFEANANIRNAVGNFQTLNSLQRQKSKRIKYIFKVHRN